MSDERKSYRDLVDEYVAAHPEASRSKARRIMQAICDRNTVRLEEFKGDARYAPLSPKEPKP
jgi:hypothetical protein